MIESVDDRELIVSAEEAIDYLGITDDTEKEAIHKLYELSKDHQTKTGEVMWPIVKGYKSKKGIAFRRWVETSVEFIKWATENKFDINKLKDGSKFGDKTSKGFHNTKLQDIDDFPNSSDHEILIAMSANIKSGESSKDALMYALYGDDKFDANSDKKKDKAKKELYDKFLNWYNHNKDNETYVNNLAKNIDVEDGELFMKFSDKNTKAQKNWKQNEESSRNPNSTPKTDLVSNKGRQISVKSGTGAQAMSGSKDETMATLLRFKYLLSEDQQKKLDSLFKDDEGNSINWNGADKERNKKLDRTIKEIFDNKDNSKFIAAVIAESITGAGKFGADSKAKSTSIITYSDAKCFEEDIETYVYHTIKNFKPSMITINTKSSGSSWANLRILLGEHKKPYDKSDVDKNDEIFKTIKSVIEDNMLGEKDQDEDESGESFEAEVKDENGKKKKVTIHIGSRGGKFYYAEDGKHSKVYPPELNNK